MGLLTGEVATIPKCLIINAKANSLMVVRVLKNGKLWCFLALSGGSFGKFSANS